MSHSPEVLAGMRAPRTVRMEEAAARAASTPEPTQEAGRSVAATAPDAGTVYISKYRRYRVQITAPREVMGSDGRRVFGDAPVVAEFDDCVYRNNHKDRSVRKMIDSALQANPYFGTPGKSEVEFWLLSDQTAAAEAAKLRQAQETLKSMPPEVLEAFVATLHVGKSEDHELPPVQE